MSVFRDYLRSEYAANPADLGGLADAACRLVRVRRSRWRGYRVARGAEVKVKGEEVPAEAVSKLRWDLLPEATKKVFSAVEKSVKDALDRYATGGRMAQDDETKLSSLVGNGVVVVDSLKFPRLKQLLDASAEALAREADDLCTEEGYAKLLEGIRKKVGETHWPGVVSLIPGRDKLRSKFGLTYELLPVRLAPDPDRDEEPAAAAGRGNAAMDVLEVAVRQPRERLAEACEHFADVLAHPAPGGTRVVGVSDAGRKRVVPAKTVRAVVDEVDAFGGFDRFADDRLREALAQLRSRLPRAAADDAATARHLSADDAAAIDLAGAAAYVARAARDEAGMCAGLAAARVNAARAA